MAVIEVLQIVSFGMNPPVKIDNLGMVLKEDVLWRVSGRMSSCVSVFTDDSVCLTFCETLDTEIDNKTKKNKKTTGE